MTAEDTATYLADIEDRKRYAETLCLVHLCVNFESDRARGTYDETEE